MGKAREVTAWSDWQPLAGVPVMTAGALAETLDGGQAFRWHRLDVATGANPPVAHEPGRHPAASRGELSPCWSGIWSDHAVQLRLGADGQVGWRAPRERTIAAGVALSRYFAVASDFTALVDSLPWRSDPHLARCLDQFSGLRILRQPFGETLLGFLCSATKQIVQIKQMLALLAARHGAPLADAGAAGVSSAVPQVPLHRLPTWAELAAIPEGDLRACLLGFRARYIADTARFLAARPGWLEETEHLPYPVAKERLCSLPGVGEKIADCVLLFGAGCWEAFPVDTWILQSLARHYGLTGWKPAHVAHFGRMHFGPCAGIAQQFLFAWERQHPRRPTSPDK